MIKIEKGSQNQKGSQYPFDSDYPFHMCINRVLPVYTHIWVSVFV